MVSVAKGYFIRINEFFSDTLGSNVFKIRGLKILNKNETLVLLADLAYPSTKKFYM